MAETNYLLATIFIAHHDLAIHQILALSNIPITIIIISTSDDIQPSTLLAG